MKQILDDMADNRFESLELEGRVERLLPMLETLREKSNNELNQNNMNPFLRRLAMLIQDSTEFIGQLPSKVKKTGVFSKVFNLSKEAANSASTVLKFAELNTKFDQIIMELSAMEIMNGSAKIGKLGATVDEIAEMLRRQVLQLSTLSDSTGALDKLYVEDPPMCDPDDERSHLGEGVFGVTHRMKCTGDGGLYAVKKIKVAKAVKNGVNKEALRNEATILQQLSHANIVRYFVCFNSQQDRFFNIVMELVAGGSLADKVTPVSPPSNDQVYHWVYQIAQGLEYMHSRRVQHRDIKPDNILLTHNSHIKIADMGLACVVTTSAAANSKVGTSAYASYEKHQGNEYDGRDDVWALGCVILELLTRARLTGPISMPEDAEVRMRREGLMLRAAAESPLLGRFLPRVLSPLQNNRVTSAQLANAVHSNMPTSLNLTVPRVIKSVPAAATPAPVPVSVPLIATPTVSVKAQSVPVSVPLKAANSTSFKAQPTMAPNFTLVRPSDPRVNAAFAALGPMFEINGLIWSNAMNATHKQALKEAGLIGKGARLPTKEEFEALGLELARNRSRASQFMSSNSAFSAVPAKISENLWSSTIHPRSAGFAYYNAYYFNCRVGKVQSEPQGHDNAHNAAIFVVSAIDTTDEDAELIRQLTANAKNGDADAKVSLAIHYLNGEKGLEKDEAVAFRWMQSAALQSHARAQHGLGWMYGVGKGCAKNDRESVRLYQLSADQNWPNGLLAMAFLFDSGKPELGLAKNQHEAIRLFQAAATLGNPTAQLILGQRYRRGIDGVDQDDREALRWLREAAKQDCQEATNDILKIGVLTNHFVRIYPTDRRVSASFAALGDMYQINGLIWSGCSEERTVAKAKEACKAKGGRLPTQSELSALVEVLSPAGYFLRGAYAGKEVGDLVSSTPLPNDAKSVYHLNQYNGNFYARSIDSSSAYRCVINA